MAAEPVTFAVPTRAIFTDQDQRAFAKSASHARLLGFVRACNESVRGLRVSDVREPPSATVLALEALLDEWAGWVADFPPVD